MHVIAFLFGIDPLLTLYAIFAFVIIGTGLAGLILFTKAKLVSSAPCTIKINDDPEMTFSTPGGVTLLGALGAHGIPIPSPCGGKATCKQCKVQIIVDAPDPIETEAGTFNKKQLKEGWRLSCQTKVKHDMHVHIEESALGVKEWEATVVSNENVATFIKELIVELPEGSEEVHYRSGGYLQVHVPPFKTNTDEWKQTMDPQFYADWEKYHLFGVDIDFSHLPPAPNEIIRAYSMASYPAEGRKLIFNIRIATPPFVAGKMMENAPWGICSSYTFSLKKGDKVKLSGPYGESYMKEGERELIFLIGGAGSSFGRSHILHLFRTDHTKRKLTMWYGARSIKENIYQKEYEDLEKEYENFKYHLVLSEPLPEDITAGWPEKNPLKTNFLFKAFEEGQLRTLEYPEEIFYYVCGPPMHNKSVLKLLDEYGVPRENIVLDDFGN